MNAGRSAQDQAIASILAKWRLTDPDTQSQFLDLLATESVDDTRRMLAESPDMWISFLQECAIVGLRQAVLESR
jgi:hypothetical protein